MKNKVLNTIVTHNLIKKGESVLLALSGGSDSVCLLHILNELKDELGFSLYACHLNHSIRDEADSDEEFVKSLCRGLGIECFSLKRDIKTLAKEGKLSEELVGRNERYKFFDEIINKHNIDLIATAHNKNDVAETILMHIFRGCGIDGQKGIAYRRQNIIRPLLDCEKKEIESFCEDNGFSYVYDKTNNEAIYTRNKIRLNIIPEIEKINIGFINTLVKNSKIIKDDAQFLNEEARKLFDLNYKDGKLDVSGIKNSHIALLRRVILLLHQEHFGNALNMQSNHIESVIKLIKSGKSGKYVNIDNNSRCMIEAGKLYFSKNKCEKIDFKYKLELEKRVYIKEAGIFITLTENLGKGEKFFFDDVDNIWVRSRKTGDIFYPEKMVGKKKISDYFTDLKIPASKRDLVPILTCNDDIVWVVNYRKDRRYLSGKKAYTILVEI